MVAKAGLGLIGLSAISIGGVAVTKPHWLGMDYMPSFHFLSEDNGFSTGYEGKFGKTYKNYLVGVTHKNGKTNETNQSWWEWSFRRLSKEKTKSDKFNKVTDGYGSSNDKDLNKVCEAAYKASSTDVDDTGGNNKFKKSDVWKYCSPGQLSTTSEDKGENAYNANKIGGDENNKATLVSVKDNSNDWFWEIRNKDFWDNEDSEWSGKKATEGSDPNKSLFKDAYEKKATSQPSIKDLCGKAYETNKVTSGTDNNNTDAKKFCVLEASS